MRDGDYQIRAIVEQVTPKRGNKVLTVVKFDRGGKYIGVSRCTTTEDELATCVARAVVAAKRFAANVY